MEETLNNNGKNFNTPSVIRKDTSVFSSGNLFWQLNVFIGIFITIHYDKFKRVIWFIAYPEKMAVFDTPLIIKRNQPTEDVHNM